LSSTEIVRPHAGETLSVRVLEISRLGIFKALFPETTEWIRWGESLTANEPLQPQKPSIATLRRLLSQAVRKEFELIVLPAIHPEHVNGQSTCKMAAKLMLRSAGSLKGAATLLNHFALGSVPCVVVDIHDGRELCATTQHLFSRSALYFKRELDLAAARCRDLGKKVRPVSLVLPDERQSPSTKGKDIDLFFAGAINSRIRARAVEVAHRLQTFGVRVYIPEQRLPYPRFMETLARSWLVLSPEGEGWDCYRHYEACLAGSVPLINRPTYERQLYLEHAKHCFYYDADGDDLERRVIELLADKPMLRRMAEAGRRHVLANHTRSAVARYILDELVSASDAKTIPKSLAPKG
jgi:glycosyl transferase family 1